MSARTEQIGEGLRARRIYRFVRTRLLHRRYDFALPGTIRR